MLNLDVDVHTGREIEAAELIHRFGRGIDNIEETLVRASLELFHGLFVHVWGAVDCPALNFGWERDGASDCGATAFGGLDDFENRAVEQHVIEGFETDTYAWCGHGGLFFLAVEDSGEDLRRHLLEVRRLHRVRGAPFRERAYGCGITEHFG